MIVLVINWVNYPVGSDTWHRQRLSIHSLRYIEAYVQCIAVGSPEDLLAKPDFVKYTYVLERNAKTILRHSRALPFIKDMFDIACRYCVNESDWVMYSNSDIVFLPITGKLLRDIIDKGYETIAITREDIVGISYDLNIVIHTGGRRQNVGQDVFLLKKKSWNMIRPLMPDYLIGEMAWDNHLQLLCQRHTVHYYAQNAPYLVKHIRHIASWKRESIGKEYNRKLWEKFTRTDCMETGKDRL